ncbi:WD repeat-containing protein 11-like [Planococcus citri]|uniref:WD repeat-containing protein 11-like n=1 Tax=Planococcus citri TaxID=170843 RepID=UPI0031F7AD2E
MEVKDIFNATELENPTKCSVVPRIITSQCHSANRGAIDWGWHGLLAYAAQCNVVIVDTKNVQQVQCLSRHKSPIKKILWSPIREDDDALNLSLVSADTSGCIGFWNVKEAKLVSFVQEGNKPVLAIEWVPRTNKDDHLYLAALHSPYSLVIWNVNKGWKEWKKSFTDILSTFSFDPFDGTKLAFLCPDCILFVDEFSVSKIPSTNGRKFYISSPRLTEENLRTRDRLKKLMRGLVVGENKPKPEDTMTISECLQLSYHRSLRNHIILLYQRDILLIDLHINMTVGVISIDKTASPLLQIISCNQRDILYCLHETGNVSVRVRRRSNSTFMMASPFDTPLDPASKLDTLTPAYSEKFLWYDYRCQSEPVRQVKGMKILSIAACPITEKQICLVLNTGRLVFLEVEKTNENRGDGKKQNNRLLSDIFPPSTTDKLNMPTNLRIITYKILNNFNWPITVVKKCPADMMRNITSNLADNINYLAIGTSAGHILFYNVLTGAICKEFSVHNNLVRGIEWCDISHVLSWSQTDAGGHKVKNELFVTNIINGQYRAIRTNIGAESPIESIRVSPLKQYFVIIKKDGKLELWNLKKLSFVRSMPDKFPVVKALDWSPIYNPKNRRKSEDKSDLPSPSSTREHLVFCDADCMLYHFSVDNNSLQDGIKIPPENLVAPITSLAFKSNKIIQADIEGQLNIWDLKEQASRVVNTNRTCISKIRFSPGKGNLKLLILFVDGGVDLYDLKQIASERIAQLKCPKDIVKVIDIDWATSYAPILVTEDGCILITDIHFQNYFSPLMDYCFEVPVKCPALIPSHLITVVHAWFSMQESENSRNTIFLSQHFNKEVKQQIDSLPVNELSSCTMGVAERSLLMAAFLGMLDDLKFWTVALYYLQASTLNSICENEPEDSGNKFSNRYFTLQPLDTSYDYLCDRYTFQKLQLEQVELHEWKRGDYQHTQRVIERLILLGEMDRAVQLLLETDFNNTNYYADAIKACLLATIQTGTGSAQSTIKLVATNFIANGKIWEGVQLLCLIGKGVDACRYLLSYGLCSAAMWLAKATLPFDDTIDVVKKCALHFKNQGDWAEAVLILISQFQWESALEILLQNSQFEKAALLLSSCRNFNITVNDELSIQAENKFVSLLEKYNLSAK